MTAFFHDEHTASAAFKWRMKHNIVVWHHPNREATDEHYAAHTGSPMSFRGATQEAAERKCAEHFNIQHWKDIQKS